MRLGSEILTEMLDGALHRKWRHPPETTQRPHEHGVTQVFQQRQIPLAVDAIHDLLDHLDAACRADTTWSALAAGLHGTELHCVARHLSHVDSVVKHDDAAMPQQRADG